MATRSVSKRGRSAARKAAAAERRDASRRRLTVCGHQLTPKQYREYEAELEARIHARPGDSLETSQAHAVHGILYRARPSVQAEKQFQTLALWRRANESFLALGDLSRVRLAPRDVKLVELHNAIIGRIASEFRAIGDELTSIHEAIAAETREVQS